MPIPLHGIAQQLELARDGDDHDDPLPADRVPDLARLERGGEVDRGPQHRGNENAGELAEDVGQRDEAQEAQRPRQAREPRMLGDLVLDRLQVGEHVPVGQADALRLGGGAGGEDDLEEVAAGEGGESDGLGRAAAHEPLEVGDEQRAHTRQ